MWIIGKAGFISVVEHDSDINLVRVRARRREHLARWFPRYDIIDLGPDANDYRWHANVERPEAAYAVAEALLEIDYDSHVKESVAGDDRAMYRAMLDCWQALHRLQEPAFG